MFAKVKQQDGTMREVSIGDLKRKRPTLWNDWANAVSFEL